MLRATLKNGDTVTVDPSQGETLADLTANLTADTLTGSAVPILEAEVRSVDGLVFAYGDVNLFIEDGT